MDPELSRRIEKLEDLCRQTLEIVGHLRDDIDTLKDEQREQSALAQSLIRQISNRMGSVENRMSAVGERLQKHSMIR